MKSHKEATRQYKSVFFLLFLLDDWWWKVPDPGDSKTYWSSGPTTLCKCPIVLGRGLQRDVFYLCWPIAPPICESKCGGRGGSCGVSANEYSCAHHLTWSPNKPIVPGGDGGHADGVGPPGAAPRVPDIHLAQDGGTSLEAIQKAGLWIHID